ncbi:unnamed protein product [Pleuronectes platessa]|uniref:Uncharacterized protein n=1 Tax=Pleuronectes platessa TaxID=8262 RepID=A0A9N7Z6Y2_PLEPL|nr:unnamed protein product [Pleuronectes platessa]
MEETVSSRLESETEQKTLHHCSAKTLTARDLGPGLPRSTRGGTEAREKKPKFRTNKDPRRKRDAGGFGKLHITEGK